MANKPIQSALCELKASHQIIRNALNVMTPEQKTAWACLNEADGYDGEGVTRANEREAAITHLDAKIRSGFIADEEQDLSKISQKLQIYLMQLTAALNVIYGEGLVSFDLYSQEIRDAYIWGLADKAARCEAMAEFLSSELAGCIRRDNHA